LSASGKGFFVPIPFWDEPPGGRAGSRVLPRFFRPETQKKTALRNCPAQAKDFQHDIAARARSQPNIAKMLLRKTPNSILPLFA
jgi:hypothetical protein